MKKLSFLLFFFIFISLACVTTFSKNYPKEDFTDLGCRLRNEIASIVLGREELNCEVEKLQSDADSLLPKLSEVIHKIDNRQITYRKEETEKLKNNINDLYVWSESIISKNKELKRREKNIHSQLKKNPELKGNLNKLINNLSKVNNEWHTLVVEIIKKIPAYFDKAEVFKNKLEKLPKR